MDMKTTLIVGIMFLITLGFFPLVTALAVTFKDYLNIKKQLAATYRRKALREAAYIAKEKGDWELADTEGRSGQRLERARIAHEIELEIRSMIGKC